MIESIKLFPMKMMQCLKEVPEQVLPVAQALYKFNHLILTGRGFTEIIAKEGALKLKEVAYIHAEAFPSGEFKHGPLALIGQDRQMPVIVMVMNDEDFKFNLCTLEQLKARDTITTIITDCKSKIPQNLYDYAIEIPSCGALTALLGVVPF